MAETKPTNPHAGVTPRPAFADLIDLASERLGGRAIIANDDFFAEKDNLLNPEPPVFIPGKFTDRGKWMDGWETRRRREPGHDWCIIKLGLPGTIRGFNVDTAHFNGNQPESCTIEAAECADDLSADELMQPSVKWISILNRTPLKPSSEHFVAPLAAAAGRRVTHLRLNIFPDGGVARLRVHGDVLPDWDSLRVTREPIDLAAAVNGGLVIDASNMHFGSRHNLIMPGRAANMGDGWETRRRRGPDTFTGAHDWCIVRLGHRGTIDRVEVDTNHFKGNFPESCAIEVADAPPTSTAATVASAADSIPELSWRPLLPRTKLHADTRHFYDKELAASTPSTHVRLKIFPDGGVSRLRVYGTLE